MEDIPKLDFWRSQHIDTHVVTPLVLGARESASAAPVLQLLVDGALPATRAAPGPMHMLIRNIGLWHLKENCNLSANIKFYAEYNTHTHTYSYHTQ